MAPLEDWNSDDTDNTDENEQEAEDNDERTKEQIDSTREYIGVNIEQRIQQSNFDIEVQDGELRGSIDDIAMLFAVMTMDFQEAEFDELINDE